MDLCMRDLFSVNDAGVVEILPQAWLIDHFKAIRDKYSSNEIAALELGLIYFAADYRSDFANLSDNVNDSIAEIKKKIYPTRNIKIDEYTFAAISFYIDNRDTTKIKLIRSVNKALLKAIDTIDSSDVDDLKEIKDLSEIISRLPSMLDNLEALEKFVKKEQQMESGIAGSGEKSMYEDDID